MIGKGVHEEKSATLDHPIFVPEGELRTLLRVTEEVQWSVSGMSAKQRENRCLREQNVGLRLTIEKYKRYSRRLEEKIFQVLRQAHTEKIRMNENIISKLCAQNEQFTKTLQNDVATQELIKQQELWSEDISLEQRGDILKIIKQVVKQQAQPQKSEKGMQVLEFQQHARNKPKPYS